MSARNAGAVSLPAPSDRQLNGAVFNLFETASDDARAPAAPGTPGHIGWHELHAGDEPSAFAFYSSLFGWTKTEVMTGVAARPNRVAGGLGMLSMIFARAVTANPAEFWLSRISTPMSRGPDAQPEGHKNSGLILVDTMT
jgi:hypothetical protein